MKMNQQFIKLSFILFICTAFIYGFSHFGAAAVEQVSSSTGNYAIGTVIGNIDLSGKTESEAESMLQQAYENWQQNAKYDFQYSEKMAPFDKSVLKLDAETTLKSIKEGQKTLVYISIDKTELEEQINILFPEVNSKDIDLNKLMNSLETSASNFSVGPTIFELNKDYLATTADNKETVITEAAITLKELPYELGDAIEKNPEIKFAAGTNFSLLEWAKNLNIADQDTLNIFATGIYQAVLPTNFSIIDRNISSVLPDYSNLGYEAMVSPSKGMDLVINNPNNTAYTLLFSLTNNVLRVSVKGQKLLYHYTITKKEEELFKPKTVIQYSPLIQSGKTVVKDYGLDGKYIKIYREIYNQDQLLKNEIISEDYYPPVYRIEIHSVAASLDGTSATIESQSGTTVIPGETNSANQTDPTLGTSQQESNSDDLWGKQHEQPK